MHISIPIEESVRFVEFTQISPLVSHCVIKVLYVGENRNNTVISKEVAEKMGKLLPASPIVGYFNEENGDFEAHNKELKINEQEVSLVDLTRPYGFVPTDAKVWFQEFQDDDGVVRDYLVTEGYLWTGTYPEAQRIVENGNNQSMELTKVEGNWTENVNSSDRFFIINEALIEKLCILGENFEPCFEGAQIKADFSLNQELTQLKETVSFMLKDIKNILHEGGSEMTEEILEENEKSLDKFEKSDSSEIQEETEEEVKTYNLDEIEEYVTLSHRFDELTNQFNTLTNDYNLLNDEVKSLREFKLQIERAQKEEMINKEFYMLSDEDKKDVLEHINDYSLDEIEAKLSVICVRNKVRFNLDEEKETETLNFSLNEIQDNAEDVPAWIKAVKQTSQNM